MKIIQVITSSFGGTIGLGDDGKLYRWITNGGIWVPNWQERRPLLYDHVATMPVNPPLADAPTRESLPEEPAPKPPAPKPYEVPVIDPATLAPAPPPPNVPPRPQ